MSQVWQTEESSKLGSVEGNCSGYEGLMVLCTKRMEELEDMVNQKLNGMISLLEQRFDEMNQRILAIGQTVDKLEVALEKLLASSRSEKTTIHDTKQRCMKLQFNSSISLPILTGEPIKGEGGEYLQLSLVDNCTGTVVDVGPEASAKVEIVALNGDLDDDERDTWTAEEFHSKIAREREGKRSILTGNLQLKLNKGTASLSDVKFRRFHYHIRGVFKLGAWVVDTIVGTRVIEAKTKSFQVIDYRRKYNQKHYPPSASDEVWRLDNIGKGGRIHDRLKRENVNSVKDFQTRFSKDPEALKCLVDLPPKKWEATVRHAQTCIPANMVGQVPAPGDACNTLVASAHEDKDASVDVEDSHLQRIPPPSTAVELLSSSGLENSKSQDIEASEMGESDPTILNNSFEDTLSSIHPTNCGRVQSSSPNRIRDSEIVNRLHSSSQGLGPYSQRDSPLTCPDIDLFELIKLNNLLDEVHGAEPCINHKSPNPAVMFMKSQAGAAKARKKSWTILFTVSKWFSRRKRRAAFQGNHDQKKQRIC